MLVQWMWLVYGPALILRVRKGRSMRGMQKCTGLFLAGILLVLVAFSESGATHKSKKPITQKTIQKSSEIIQSPKVEEEGLSLEELDKEYERVKKELDKKHQAVREKLKKKSADTKEIKEPVKSTAEPKTLETVPSTTVVEIEEDEDSPATVLEEVFVTATKEKEVLKDIAGEVGIIKSETIENTTANSLHEVLKFMPGVTVQQRFGTDDVNISIRGSGIRQSFGVRGIQVLVDGIPLTEPDGQTRLDLIDLATIERIEVVKGPASTIYGGNSTGGVVNLITKKGAPNSGMNGETAVWGGSFGYYKGYASAYGGEGKHKYFAGFSHSQKGGFRNHSQTDGQRFNANMQYKINEKSDLQFFLAAGQINLLLPGALTLNQMKSNPQQANTTAVARRANRFDDRFRLGIMYKNQITDDLQASVSGYWDWRQLEHIPVFQFLEISRIGAGDDVRFTYTRNLLGYDNKLIVGSSFQHQSTRENDYAVVNGDRGALVADEDSFLNHFGIYAQDQFFINRDLSVTGGVRYSRFEFGLEDHFFADGNQSNEVIFEKATPRIGVNWTPIKDINLFANYSTAFQTPTLSEITSGAGGGFINLQPETVNNYEVGSRGNFVVAGMPASFEVTYFRMYFHNKILPRRIGFLTTFVNAGDTLHEGVSAGLGLDVTRHLNTQLSYTYSDFRFTSGQFENNKVPGQTPHQFLGAMYYKFFLPQKTTLSLGGEFRYSHVFHVDDSNFFTNQTWSTVTLKAKYKSGRFGAQLVADNITDEIYSDAVSINSNNGQFFNPADGLSVTGNVSWDF